LRAALSESAFLSGPPVASCRELRHFQPYGHTPLFRDSGGIPVWKAPLLADGIALDHGLNPRRCTLPAQRNIVRPFRRNYRPRNNRINSLMLEMGHVPCRSRNMGKSIPILSPARLGPQKQARPHRNIGAILPKSKLWGSLRILPWVAVIVIGYGLGSARASHFWSFVPHTHGKSSRASLPHHSPVVLIDTLLWTTTNEEAVSYLVRRRKIRSVAGVTDRRSLACANFR
jgi:hypothetical protein